MYLDRDQESRSKTFDKSYLYMITTVREGIEIFIQIQRSIYDPSCLA